MLRWCWLLTLAACGFRSPNGNGGADAAPADDASPTTDDGLTDSRSPLCFGSFAEVCLAGLPEAAITVNGGATLTINTQPGSQDCVATTSDAGACVVAAASISVDGTIRGIGPRPLVLLATGSIVVNMNGVIDVASHRGAAGAGAGANASRCVAGSTPTVITGGWGGSNATKGGDGDRAGSGSTGGNASSALPRPVAALFGGCAGGKGAGGTAGNGGAGGGAVDLIAAVIVINGTVNASGAGASGASDNSDGGGGGGSGGMIVLDAPDVTINGSAKVFAQGGSGGEGGPSNISGNGSGGDGTDPTVPGQAAAGGIGGGSGGNGGDGATTTNGGNGGEDGGLGDDGGGGGGGGAGFIITTDPMPPTPPLSNVCPAFG
jgi:hypothetical protein